MGVYGRSMEAWVCNNNSFFQWVVIYGLYRIWQHDIQKINVLIQLFSYFSTRWCFHHIRPDQPQTKRKNPEAVFTFRILLSRLETLVISRNLYVGVDCGIYTRRAGVCALGHAPHMHIRCVRQHECVGERVMVE